jgi:nicotinic acid mononucleotide adenylyltransferase
VQPRGIPCRAGCEGGTSRNHVFELGRPHRAFSLVLVIDSSTRMLTDFASLAAEAPHSAALSHRYHLAERCDDSFRSVAGWFCDGFPAASLWALPSPDECAAGRPDAAAANARLHCARHVAILGGSFNPITVGHLAVAREVMRAAGRRNRHTAPARCLAACEDDVEDGGRCERTPESQAPLIDELWIVPCGARPDKPSLNVSPWHRFAMCVLAVEDALPCLPADTPDTAREGAPAPMSAGHAAGDGHAIPASSDAVLLPPELAARIRVMPLELWEASAVPSYRLLTGLTRAFPDTLFSLIVGADILDTLPAWKHPRELLQQITFLLVPRPGYELASTAAAAAAAEPVSEATTAVGSETAAVAASGALSAGRTSCPPAPRAGEGQRCEDCTSCSPGPCAGEGQRREDCTRSASGNEAGGTRGTHSVPQSCDTHDASSEGRDPPPARVLRRLPCVGPDQPSHAWLVTYADDIPLQTPDVSSTAVRSAIAAAKSEASDHETSVAGGLSDHAVAPVTPSRRTDPAAEGIAESASALRRSMSGDAWTRAKAMVPGAVLEYIRAHGLY